MKIILWFCHSLVLVGPKNDWPCCNLKYQNINFKVLLSSKSNILAVSSFFSCCLFSVVTQADFHMFGASMPISSTFTSVNSQVLVLMVFKLFLPCFSKLLKMNDWNCMQY